MFRVTPEQTAKLDRGCQAELLPCQIGLASWCCITCVAVATYRAAGKSRGSSRARRRPPNRPWRAALKHTRGAWPSDVRKSRSHSWRCDPDRRVVLGSERGDVSQGVLDVRLADAGQALDRRAARGDGGQALIGVTAVLFQVSLAASGTPGLAAAVGGVEVAAGDQVFGQSTRLVARSGPETH